MLSNIGMLLLLLIAANVGFLVGCWWMERSRRPLYVFGFDGSKTSLRVIEGGLNIERFAGEGDDEDAENTVPGGGAAESLHA